MIFSKDIVFIHIGKTGGMSCSSYLLQNLRTPIHNCHAQSVKENDRVSRSGITAVTDSNRHCTLQVADQLIRRLTGTSISDREKVLAVIRHPYTLEYSFYRHLQKPAVAQRRKKQFSKLVKLAQGDFKTFVANPGYHRLGLRQEDYFLIDGKMPDNLALLRFEQLSYAFPDAVANYTIEGCTGEFPWLNSSKKSGELQALLDPETRALIYKKHQYMFDQGYYSTDFLL
jgi:hypothetical protein